MSISSERLEAIRQFHNTDFSDCPILTDEQLSQMQPCHLAGRAAKPQKKVLNIRIDAGLLDTLKASGKGWQTRVNAWIRSGIEAKQL